MEMEKIWDVIIAGAGPVGLFLACELATAGGLSVLILERETQLESPWKEGLFGRRGIYTPSVEAFYRRGMLNKIFAADERPMHFEKTEGFQFGGHFAGLVLNANNIDFSRWPYHLPGPSLLPGATSLGRLEAVLLERAKTLGVQVIRGMEVCQLDDRGDSVKVWAGDQCFTAQWLVGCDGGCSTVRKAAGFDFVGTDAQFTGYIAACDLDRPELLEPGFTYTTSGMYIFSAPRQLHVMDFDRDFDRSQPITREHFQEVLQRVSGTNIVVEALQLSSTFTDRSMQATEYRRGRILLAGDSAHIHSPLGAQGLSTGIGDAMNLGWKLAATIKGVAPPGLLDTYSVERHPEAARVLEWTRAQVATLRPDSYGQAVRSIMRDMINTQDGATYLAGRIWGISLRYNLGDTHPLVGCSAPDFEFDDGLRLGAKVEKGGFWVIDFGGSDSVAECVRSLQLRKFTVHYSGCSARETLGLEALLLRPDGIVAWVSTGKVDIRTLQVALSQWISLAGLDA
ncbi:FAD binding domain-containing protein [Aspergillus bertholletiae]|uniref:FAD binding domain-containing protein n=1 Tax=Aspergillus bertholletiae TaxID=1226010 RepID=A0A5N7B172_9EURO|nr:FAD binding domain-containing protein [Aspergillus bertholletiae]